MSIYSWRVYCINENQWVTTNSPTKPTTCPNNGSHNIRSVQRIFGKNFLTTETTDNSDIGFYGTTVELGVTKYHGLFFDRDTNNFKLFKDSEELPVNQVNQGALGFTTANLDVENLTVSGNLQVTGNLGVTGTENQIDHSSLLNIGTNTHSQIDSHIADNTLHFTEASIDHSNILNVGTNTHAQIDTHIADGTLHFTESSINHSNIQNSGTFTHAQIDSHISNSGIHFTESSIDHTNILNIGTNTHTQIDNHIADATLHFTEASIDHTNITNVGTNTHTQIDSHIADSTLHFTEASIDHTAIQNVGTNSHAQIDSHIASSSNPHSVTIDQLVPFTQKGDILVENALSNAVAFPIGISGQILTVDDSQLTGLKWNSIDNINIDHTNLSNIGTNSHSQIDTHIATGGIHFTEASIDHTAIQNIGTNTHTQIDSHIADSTLHFTEASISHLNIGDVGTNTHAQIDTHIADATLHFTEASISHLNIGDIGTNTHAQIDSHISSTSNPHSVTLDQITPTTTKGDILVENATQLVRLPLGVSGQVLAIDDTTDTCLTWKNIGALSGGGESNTGNNIGVTGKEIFKEKSGIFLNFRGLVAGDDIELVQDDKNIVINSNANQNAGESNTASNQGVGGVGIFKQKTGVDLEFKNINSGSNKITITDDTGNNEIDIDIDQTNIDHTQLQNIGTNSHAQIDSHIADATIHFTEASIDHTAIQNVGTNTHAQIDTHIADGTLHFTEASISHLNIGDVGTNTHAQIDSHISSTSNPHSVTIDQITPTTNKGDILVEDGLNVIRLPSGIDGQHLAVNSATSSGLEWQTINLGEDNTASNVGVSGVGVFKQKNGIDLEFKNIYSGSNKITITDDVVNNEIDIDIIESNIVHQNLSGAGSNTHAQIDSHIASSSNPHSVTLNQITPTTTKGDIIAETGTNAISFSIGTTGQILTVNTDTATSLEWKKFDDLYGTIDHTLLDNIGTNSHAQIDSHIADTSIHFTESSINHANITNIGTNTHAQIDSHIADGTLHFTEASISHLNIGDIGTNTHAQIDTHIATAGIHFTEASIDHTNITNVGTNTHTQIDTHIADSSIHFTEAAIDHTAISNIGTNSHTQIDTHIASSANPHNVTINQIVPFDSKGDILVENNLGNAVSLDVGTSGQFLTADSSTDTGLSWKSFDEVNGATDHNDLLNKGANTHAQIDSHIADSSIHFTEASISHLNIGDIGTNTHTQIDTHIADATIHFTEASIDHTAIQNVGTNTHAQIDTHIASNANPHSVTIDQITPTTTKGDLLVENGSNVVSLSLGTTGQILAINTDTSTGVEWIDIENLQTLDHNNLLNNGTNTHSQIDTHIADATIHFTEASIDHTNISNVGTNTHAQIDTHIADGTLHFTEASIDHMNISNIGTNTHAQIDSHISNSNIHFTEASISHLNIGDIGTNTHAQIDTHIAATNNPHSVTIDQVTPTNTKGDLLVENGSNVISFPIGTTGQVLAINTDTSTGLEWADIENLQVLDHTQLTNIGTNSHAQIDTHIADATIHFTEASIDHTAITNVGTNTHAQIDTHIADGTIHFTEASIDHTAIQNIGTNSHAQIDTHIASNTNPHSVTIDQITPTTTKGDLLVENGTIVTRLPVGTNGQILSANSAQATGLEWIPSSAMGEDNTASNVGTGEGIFKIKNGVDLEFKSLIGGTNINLVGNTNDININLDDNVSLTGNLNVDGNLIVGGTTTTLNTETIVIEDPLQKLAGSNTANIVDTGTYALYIEGGVTKFNGIFRDATDNTFKLFTGLEVEPTTTVNTTGTGYTRADLDIGNLDVLGNIVVSGTVDGRDIATDGTNQDTHIADATIHFTEASINHANITNIGTNTHAQIDTHIADATIHFTEASIDHTAIQNVGTNSHTQIDSHISSTANPHSVTIDQITPTTLKGDILVEDGTNIVRLGTGTNNQVLTVDTSTASGLKWATFGGGETNTASNINAAGIGVFDGKVGTDLQFRGITSTNSRLSVVLDAVNNEIDLTVNEANIVHQNISGSGTNTHAQIDTHIADATIHFTEASIDHTAIQNIGTNTHAQIDTHIADATIHFTEASIDHTAIQNVGSNTHAQIDGHISSTANPHSVTIDQITPTTTKGDIIVENTTSATRLPVGTNGQYLSVNTGTATSLEWTQIDHTELSSIGTNTHAQIDTHIASTNNPHSVNIDQITPTTTKGDILVENGTIVTRLATGTNNQVLTVDTSTGTGLKWATPNTGENNTASNINVGGIGVFDNKNGVDLQFRGINSTTNRITVALDAPNNEIDLTLNEANIDHTNLANVGTNSHAQIDTHIASTANPHSVTIDQITPTTTKGDILVEDGTNVIRLASGTNGQVLTINTGTATGLEWSTAGGGGETNTASNVNVGGIGVFDGKVGVDLQFRGINTTTNRITVALDAANNEIDLTLNEGNIVHQNISGSGTNTHAQIDSHIASTANPHSVTIDQITPTTTKGDILVENGTIVTRLPVGTNGQVLSANSVQATGLEWITNTGGGGSTEVAVIRDTKGQGTNGGTFTAGAWQIRTLNTLNQSGTFVSSLTGNQFTIDAGTYLINATAPGYAVDSHKIRLFDVTNTTVVAYGISQDSTSAGSADTGSNSELFYIITPGASNTYRIEHQCSSTNTGDGFGLATGFGTEVYTIVILTKIA